MNDLALSWEHYQAGRYLEADQLCRGIVEADPESADAWYLLGLNNVRLNRVSEAESSYRRVVAVRPEFADAHCHLGVVLAIQGRLEDAIASYKAALTLAPRSADAHNNLGMALCRLGRLVEGTQNLLQAVESDPGHPMAASNLGQVLAARGNYGEMADVFRSILRRRPDHLVARLRLGEALLYLNELDEARNCFEAALRLAPASSAALVGLGLILVRLKRFDEAVSILKRVVEINPEEQGAHAVLAKALTALGRFDEALAVYDTVLRLRPDDPEANHNRGFVLDELRRCDEALASYEQAIRLAPGHSEAHHNRGVVLGKLARYDEAIASFDEAIRLAPDYAEARRNRALALLTLGKLEQGWREFEWRWRCSDLAMPAHPRPLWNGEPVPGHTILLHVEQGLGDTIQFIRYAALVKERAGRVVVECQAPLVRILKTCPGIDQVVARGEALPEFDSHTPLLRLMGLFTTTLETIPASIPYLAAEAARTERWRERLRAWPGFRIGIAWQGNPRHTRDPDRSFPLAQFERLARIEGIRLISLQKGFGVEQLRQLGNRRSVIDLGEEVDPSSTTMRDTPALMMGLDLVITPDTSLAHLAGALGVPVWIALPRAPDWRWLTDREDSPWYPTARLFRQPERGRWDIVFDRITAALEEELALRGIGRNPEDDPHARRHRGPI
jgi:tetratricopeptide (TPR) repeat protein